MRRLLIAILVASLTLFTVACGADMEDSLESPSLETSSTRVSPGDDSPNSDRTDRSAPKEVDDDRGKLDFGGLDQFGNHLTVKKTNQPTHGNPEPWKEAPTGGAEETDEPDPDDEPVGD